MKIALINPNSPFLIDERVFPNMGLIRVATQLEKEGHNVKIHDFAGRDPSKIRNIAHNYDVFGFSSTTPQFPYTMGLFKLLKSENPNARTIIGGPHASAMYSIRQKGIPDPNIEDLEVFDTIFAGEGEETSRMFKPGWQKADLIKDIDSLPIPDRHFLDMDSYHYKLFGKKTASIQTQRGCPFECTFCSGRDIEMYNHTRMHSIDRVIKELDQLNEDYGVESFMWYDDEINLNPSRLEKLCIALSKRDYQHRGFIRSDLIVKHPESVKWLKKAGFVKLCAGVESGSDRILKVVNKGITSQQNLDARKLIGNAGIHYESFLIVGHPSETPKDIELTIEWLKRANPDDFDINVLTIYPGSKIYDDAVKSNKFANYKWTSDGLYFNKPNYSRDNTFYKGHDGKSASATRTDLMSEGDIHQKREEIQRLK